MAEQPSVESVSGVPARLASLPEPRWPAVAAFVTSWLCPTTSAKRMLHVGLWSAYAIHLAAALLTFLMITVQVSLVDYGKPFTQLGYILHEFTGNSRRDAVLILAATVVGIEFGFLFLALIVIPWGAGEERIRTSWAHALRIVWLHTTHALPCVLLVGTLCVVYTNVERDYYQHYQYPPLPPRPLSPPIPPSGVSADSQANRDYQAALKEYHRSLDRQREQQKLIDKCQMYKSVKTYGPLAITWIGTGCAAWILWAISRGLVVRGPTPAVERPPICEFCGYNLIATPMESRCPECGQLVVDSLGPQVRPGTAWDRVHPGGMEFAWLTTSVMAILSPGQVGQQVQIRETAGRHRSFLISHLALIFLAGALGALACLCCERGHIDDGAYGIVLAVFGSLSVLPALMIAGLTAGSVGLAFSLRTKRNLLGASMQMACYLGSFLSLWATISSAVAVCMFILTEKHLLRPLAKTLQMDHEFLGFCLWFLPNLVLLVVYFTLVWRGTSRAQYANK